MYVVILQMGERNEHHVLRYEGLRSNEAPATLSRHTGLNSKANAEKSAAKLCPGLTVIHRIQRFGYAEDL